MCCEIFRSLTFESSSCCELSKPTYFPPRERWVAGFSFLVCDNVGEQGLSHRLAIWWRKLKFLTPLQSSPPTASQIFRNQWKPCRPRDECVHSLSPPGPDPPPSCLLRAIPGGCGQEEKENSPLNLCCWCVFPTTVSVVCDGIFLTPLRCLFPYSFSLTGVSCVGPRGLC